MSSRRSKGPTFRQNYIDSWSQSGLKNFLFVGSDRGGKAAATHYSLVESCKNVKINPLMNLKDVLERLRAAHTEKEILALIPEYWNLS